MSSLSVFSLCLLPFLRSFYKHVLGNPVDYTDLEAIEPEIFKSLKQILNLRLEDLGLELTFSAESHIFGIHEVRTILYCTVLQCTVLYCAVLHCTVR